MDFVILKKMNKETTFILYLLSWGLFIGNCFFNPLMVLKFALTIPLGVLVGFLWVRWHFTKYKDND